MGGYYNHNNSVIERAFSRMLQHEDEIIRNGMYGILDAGLDYLHEAHGLLHPGERHEHENDTLGWALVKDGQIVEAVSQSKGEWTPYGDALRRLGDIARGKKGWIGIVLSDMANNWYRVDWENDYLSYSADMVKDHFNDFFKPIA